MSASRPQPVPEIPRHVARGWCRMNDATIGLRSVLLVGVATTTQFRRFRDTLRGAAHVSTASLDPFETRRGGRDDCLARLGQRLAPAVATEQHHRMFAFEVMQRP